jgi:hypothetical protein
MIIRIILIAVASVVAVASVIVVAVIRIATFRFI